MICEICPRKCGADRSKKCGFCGAPEEFRLARAALHYWEEPCISGKNGSGAVFFSGCNLKCAFCQNYEISALSKGVNVTDEKLINIFESLIASGAHNINLVSPTHYAARLAVLFEKWHCPVPVIYNSSGYESVGTLKLLEGKVDVYLPDLKYIRQDKAERYSKAQNYFLHASNALDEMYRQSGDCEFDSNGIIKKGMIIRHLILPANTNSSLEIIDYIAKKFPRTPVSLMAQYVPCNDLSACGEINRKITKREYDKVVSYAQNKIKSTVYIQELSSSDEKFIPEFDFTGVL